LPLHHLKQNLQDIFFVPKREELKQNGRKQQDEGDAGE
jgi:hypothetical protein